MANLLLVDPAEVARKALQGILARGRHRLAAVPSTAAAMEFLQQNEITDLVVLEMELEGEEDGLALLRRLRAHPFLRQVPVIVYTSLAHRDAAPAALALGVQNFLFKPYVDTDVFTEVGKATAHPWRQALFAEEKTFCARQRVQPDELRRRLETLRVQLEGAGQSLASLAAAANADAIFSLMEDLVVAASESGAVSISPFLEELWAEAEQTKWNELADAAATVSFAGRLVANRIHPGHVTEGFLSEHERHAQEEAKARAVWTRAIAEDCLPVVPRSRLERQLDELHGCPVVDSAAAGFQMAATGHPSSLAPLMDLADKDPGLCAQVLIAANHARQHEDTGDPVDNARLSIGLLGEERLSQLARQLVTVEARLLDHPPFSWPQFWMFQLGVAQLARHTCTYLGLESLESRAYTAGLLHDLGTLLLARLEPFGLRAALDYARQHRIPLAAAQRKLLDCTGRELAARFAERHRMPECYVSVIRWLDTPAQATTDAALVAVVSLARDLCLLNHVGSSGENRKVELQPLDRTAEWEILRAYVYPSFNLHKFEAQVHAMSRELTRELSGRANPILA